MTATPGVPEGEPSATARQIRGSSLLLVGRVLALALNLGTQVLIVRLLAKADYGAFAYGLAVVSTARTVVGLGHHQVLTRFFSIYEDRRQYDKLFGTIVMEISTIVGAGLFLYLALVSLRDTVGGSLAPENALNLLLILILLAPIEALERVFESLLDVFSRPRAIFVRKYLLTPGLRLTVVLLVLLVGDSVQMLAVGYVLTGVLGLGLYAVLVVKVLREGRLLQHFRPATITMPFREVFGFALPLLTTELVYISITFGSVFLVGYYAGSQEVAEYRAVYPAAQLNQLVLFTFALLFTPLAARMYARGDREGMSDAYWQTAAWLSVLTFPMMALTVPLAEPTTFILFGERYEESAPVLALLSLGYYFGAALGFNALTLATYGKLRVIVGINATAAVVNLVASVALIPRHGALGAAAANALTLVMQNVLNQVALRTLGIPAFPRRYARVYVVVVLAALGVVAAQVVLSPPALVSPALAVIASAAVVLIARRALDVESTFPEILRVPMMRRLFGS